MKTCDVLKLIKEQGGFNNWQHWSKKEVAIWVKANYHCSTYISRKVASLIA